MQGFSPGIRHYRVGVPEQDLEMFTALDRLSLALLKQAQKRHSEIIKREGREEEGNR